MSSSVQFVKMFWTILSRQFCSHYSCVDCLFQVIEFADGPPSCSMCNVHLTYESDIRCAQGFLSNSFVNWISIAKDVTRSYSTKIVEIICVMLHHEQRVQPLPR